jgi:hypothetical protein
VGFSFLWCEGVGLGVGTGSGMVLVVVIAWCWDGLVTWWLFWCRDGRWWGFGGDEGCCGGDELVELLCLTPVMILSRWVAVWWWLEVMLWCSGGEVLMWWHLDLASPVRGWCCVWVVFLDTRFFDHFIKSVEICDILFDSLWYPNLLRFACFLCIRLTSTSSVLIVWRWSASWDLSA